jgi:hypothetical protein
MVERPDIAPTPSPAEQRLKAIRERLCPMLPVKFNAPIRVFSNGSFKSQQVPLTLSALLHMLIEPPTASRPQ